jgi:hypothetical protein
LEEFGAAGGAIATGATATATSTSITISTATILTAQVTDPADPAELVGLVNLVGPGELAGLAGLANLSGSTDQSTEEMHPTQIKGRQTSLAVGLRGSPHAELLIGPLPELVLAAELAPVGPEKEVESPLVHRVERRLAPVAGLAPGHPLAQLPVVARTA